MTKFDQRVEEVVEAKVADLRDLFLADDPEPVLQALRKIQDDLSNLSPIIKGIKSELQKVEHRQGSKDEENDDTNGDNSLKERAKDMLKKLLNNVRDITLDALIPDSVTPLLNQLGDVIGLPEIKTGITDFGMDAVDPVIEAMQDPIGTAAKAADIVYKIQLHGLMSSIEAAQATLGNEIRKIADQTGAITQSMVKCCNDLNNLIIEESSALQEALKSCCQNQGESVKDLRNNSNNQLQLLTSVDNKLKFLLANPQIFRDDNAIKVEDGIDDPQGGNPVDLGTPIF